MDLQSQKPLQSWWICGSRWLFQDTTPRHFPRLLRCFFPIDRSRCRYIIFFWCTVYIYIYIQIVIFVFLAGGGFSAVSFRFLFWGWAFASCQQKSLAKVGVHSKKYIWNSHNHMQFMWNSHNLGSWIWTSFEHRAPHSQGGPFCVHPCWGNATSHGHPGEAPQNQRGNRQVDITVLCLHHSGRAQHLLLIPELCPHQIQGKTKMSSESFLFEPPQKEKKRFKPDHENQLLTWNINSKVMSLPLPPMVPQTVCLTLGVLTVRVKGRVARSRWRTEFVAIFVLSCLHVHFRRYLCTFRVATVVGRGFCL